MKILFINTFYAPHNAGGAENSLRIIVEALHRSGHDVVVLAATAEGELQEESVNGVKVYRGGIRNEYWIYDNSIKHSFYKKARWVIKDIYNSDMAQYLRVVIEREKPDIVSCHNVRGWSISIWDVIKESDIPVVQVLHDFYSLCRRGALFNKGQACENRCFSCKILKSLHKRKSQEVNAVVGVCQDILDRHLAEGYFGRAITDAIHNVRTISEKELRPFEYNKPFTLGFIGSLTDNKGVLWLIQQFKKVHSSNVILKIAGRGDEKYETMLKSEAKNDRRISFLGHVKSDGFYSEIDALVIPSIWYEPLASVAIEACGNHVPVITSGMGGLKEVIINEVNGLVCSYSDPDSLSRAIERLITDSLLYNNLQKSARTSVHSFLNLPRLVAQYENLYRAVIKEHSSTTKER